MLLCFDKPVTVKDDLELVRHTIQCLLLFLFPSQSDKTYTATVMKEQGTLNYGVVSLLD